MAETLNVLKYPCPCCGATLVFGEESQKMTCEYCDNSFDLETVQACSEDNAAEETFNWDSASSAQWDEAEQSAVRSFTCQSCGGELLTDQNTAATFCPYCESPTILPGRLSGGIRPDAVLPFQKTKEDATAAFIKLCKGKPLLPKDFSSEHRVEKLTGIYVPFWLYDCESDFHGKYKATRVRSWSDPRYHYTKTDHYMLIRSASAEFISIPMDASSKMENTIMESIEPFDFSQMSDFDTTYLSGFYADKYDVEADQGKDRIRQRVNDTMEQMVQSSMIGYTSTIPTSRQLNIQHSKAKYVLLPAWMLHTKYRDKTYVFAMNGQTGKMTGTFPVCPKRSAAWFAGICAGVTTLVSLVTLLVL